MIQQQLLGVPVLACRCPASPLRVHPPLGTKLLAWGAPTLPGADGFSEWAEELDAARLQSSGHEGLLWERNQAQGAVGRCCPPAVSPVPRGVGHRHAACPRGRTLQVVYTRSKHEDAPKAELVPVNRGSVEIEQWILSFPIAP